MRCIVLTTLAKSFGLCVGNKQMSLFPFFSFSSNQCQCSSWLSKCCSNRINILYTTAFHAAVQGVLEGNYWISAMTRVDWAGEHNNKPLSTSGREVLSEVWGVVCVLGPCLLTVFDFGLV